MQWLLRCLIAVAATIPAFDGRGSQADGAPVRSTSRSVDAGGTALTVFEYRPSGCRIAGLLVVFHGLDRNASDYRDHARPIADRLCLVVAAPLFDERRFPTWRYQRGGVVDRGDPLPTAAWTVTLVAPLVASLQSIEGTSGQPFYLLGHSAGAQFLSRVAAYTSSAAARIVIANPSTHVLPDVAEAVPYGFGGLPRARERLRDYLARPVTLLLGDDDVGDKNLAEGDAALRQGATRLERGRRTFRMAEAAARANGWPFGWREVEVPGVGHSARSMFASPQAIEALTGGPPPSAASPSDRAGSSAP